MEAERKKLLTSQEYWMVQIQNDLYAAIDRYMKLNKINRTQLAVKLGVSKGYVTQILNGDFDHKLSKLVDLALKCGCVPLTYFVKLEEYLANDDKDKYYELMPMIRPITIDYKTSANSKVSPPPFYKFSKGNDYNTSFETVIISNNA